VGQVPYVVYVAPILALVAFFFMRSRMKNMLTKGEAQNAAYRAGEVAKRIGLEVTQGDPNINFAYARSLLTKGDGGMPEVHVRLEGAPGGRHGEVVYYERKEVDTGFTSTTYTTYFDGHISVEVRAPFPEFEIVLRSPPSWVGSPKLKSSAPVQSFRDAALDKHYILRAADARVAPVIAEGMRSLMTQQFVHVYGNGKSVTFAFTVETLGHLCLADQIYFALDQLAVSLDQAGQAHGTSAPALMSA
jgi:hypothetical protein